MRARQTVAALALLLLPARVRSAPQEAGWPETVSPHFRVRHETAFLPQGFVLGLEKIHNRLRMDLARFTPWMEKERIDIFFYKDQRSYLNGKFRPPRWSNGVAFYDRKTLAVHDQRDRRKLMTVISHELTHLFFESYWGEARKVPPSWINEGLAMLEESDGPQEKSEWYLAMPESLKRRRLAFDDVLRLNPTRDLAEEKEVVTLWYVQAYSYVYFLSRRRSSMQFFNFCRELRDGKPAAGALWSAYRFAGAGDFEKAWLEWMKLPPPSRRPGSASPGGPRPAGDGGGLQPHGFKGFSYDGLRRDKGDR